MKNLKKMYVIMSFSIGFIQPLIGYDLPGVNLGLTNILDGGPNQPHAGLYWLSYFFYYNTHQYLDACGNPLGGVKSPTTNATVLINELSYQSDYKVLGGRIGAAIVVPIVLSSTTSSNALNLIDAGSGFSNPILISYIQWDPIMRKGRRIFECRVETNLFLPIGTNKFPEKTINPSAKMTHVDTYWAASLFLTEKITASWRTYYLWCGQNKKTNIQPGGTYHMNFSMEYEVYPKSYLGIVGYYLQQLQNSKQCGIQLPDSKERLLGVGPGFLCYLPHGFDLFGYLYFETKVQNRTKGIRAVVRFIKSF